jgi:hypothetical protein
MTANEFEENILSGGPITLTNGTGSFSLTSKNTGTDARASQVFTVKLKNNGTIVAESVAVTLGAVATSYYSTPGTFAWTVPSSVSRLVISAVGGGGGSYGWHSSGGYTTYASPGGPGGGVDGVIYQVVSGTSTSIVIGAGGSYGVEWINSGYGTPGTPTSFTYNGTRVFICDQGPMASGQTAGVPGSATIDASNTGGVVRQGTSGISGSHGEDSQGGGYNIWRNIDTLGYSISYAGTQAIYPPAAIADRARAGLVQYHGWMAITQIPETIYNWTTYGSHTFTVPDGVTSIWVSLTGASGGTGGGDSYGGAAGYSGSLVSGYLSVIPGQIITVGIGGAGGNGRGDSTVNGTAGGVAGSSTGSSTSFAGGRGGYAGPSGSSGSGGAGGAASFVLIGTTVAAVAGGGGGGAGGGRYSGGHGQTTGAASTTVGDSGGDHGGDGGGGGGGGGGYLHGGVGGSAGSGDNGGYSGANGQSFAPNGWTITANAGQAAGTAGIVYIKY